MTPTLDHLPVYGLHTLLVYLNEDYQRTGEKWFAETAELVRDEIGRRFDLAEVAS